MMKDLFGKAILDYQTDNNPQNLVTETSISEEDEMSVAYLFRNYSQMPQVEQKALQLSKGKILDVGCGAGSHSLYLQEEDFDVTAIDISPNAVEACRLRGLKKTVNTDVMAFGDEKYDTILLLMNGTGICGRLSKIGIFLQKLKTLLNYGGQILLDSSDIIYMFDEDEIPSDTSYYGEVIFKITYKGESELPFDWLYIDYDTLKTASEANGLNCDRIMEGNHFDYLARLTIKE